jgi:hypothetical protein
MNVEINIQGYVYIIWNFCRMSMLTWSQMLTRARVGMLHQVLLLKLQMMVFLRGTLLLTICILCFAFMWSTFIFLLSVV